MLFVAALVLLGSVHGLVRNEEADLLGMDWPSTEEDELPETTLDKMQARPAFAPKSQWE
jgi:hypothetical protein